MKWHDTDFGEENAANGTPYVLLQSDLKKKLDYFEKKAKKLAKNENKPRSTGLQPICLCNCRHAPWTWDLSTESDKH